MNQRLQGTLIGLAIMFVFVALGVRRRMRPQPVRPNRIVLFSVLIVLLVGLSFVGTGAHLIANPLAVALAPVCLVIGVALGFFEPAPVRVTPQCAGSGGKRCRARPRRRPKAICGMNIRK